MSRVNKILKLILEVNKTKTFKKHFSKGSFSSPP